jgi:hypothetical protein
MKIRSLAAVAFLAALTGAGISAAATAAPSASPSPSVSASAGPSVAVPVPGDFQISGTDAVFTAGSDGKYRATTTVTVHYTGTATLDQPWVFVVPPDDVDVTGVVAGSLHGMSTCGGGNPGRPHEGVAWSCEQVGLTPGATVSGTFTLQLRDGAHPATEGHIKIQYGYPDAWHSHAVTGSFHLSVATTPPSASATPSAPATPSASASGTGSGSGSSLPVTGAPLGLLSAGGTALLAAGAATLLLLRRRRTA